MITKQRVYRLRKNLTDRALRYRASAHPPAGPKICCLCGSEQNVEIGHIDGHEEHSNPVNLFWTCRSCNVRCGNTLRKNGLGRPVSQWNPAADGGATSLGQWLVAVSSMKGDSDAMSVKDAIAMIHATPPERRSQFASQIWSRRRKRYGKSGRQDEVPF